MEITIKKLPEPPNHSVVFIVYVSVLTVSIEPL